MRTRMLVTLATLALALGACGGDDTDTSGGGPAGTAGTGGAQEEEPDGPQRIVSLSPASTEILFAIGAGDQVVAVDDRSDHPLDAPRTDLSGYEPNVEAIASYEPDLVVMDSPAIEGELETLGIDLFVAPAPTTFDELYQQIEQMGKVTGNESGAAGLVTDMRDEIDDIVATIPDDAQPLTYYHELDQTLFSVTSNTFIGQVYALAGLENIADAADAEGSGYPQLSAEYIVDADPDLVFLADTKCCGQSAETVAARPGWGALVAVQQGNVIELDDDIASRWGPRVVDFLRVVVDAANEARAA